MGCWVALLVIGGGVLAFMVLYATYLWGAFSVLETEEETVPPPVTAPQPQVPDPNAGGITPQ